MHPVESTLYYSAALIPVSLGLHPVHALGSITFILQLDCELHLRHQATPGDANVVFLTSLY